MQKEINGSKTTTDQHKIKAWAEERGAKPAKVKGTTILRFDFAGGNDNELDHIKWEEWFKIFDENKLALLYQDSTADGESSRFFKIVSRNTEV
jgi:hypothetical protein